VSEAVGCQLENVRVRGREDSWVLYGSCVGELSRQGWLVKTEVNPAPLVKLLRPLKVQQLAVHIRHPRVGLSNSSTSKSVDKRSQFYVKKSYNIPVATTATTEPLHIEFGYSPSDIVRIFVPLGGFLLVPIGLMLWMRQAALRVQKTDPAAVWFNYLRFLNWVVLGIWLVWFPVRFTSGVQNFIDFALWGSVAWQKMAVNFSLSFLPPAIAIVFCYALSHPVFAKVRGVDWTRGDLIRQAAFSQCSTFLPLMLLIDGITALGEDGRLGVACFAAAFVSRVLFAGLLRDAQNMTPHALTVGELRDRIFDLAEKAGVKLQQVYLLPAGKGQLANAFASSGNIIML
ncbi:MAG: hypothetical protein ICV86_19485, partial [Microcoleus sp. T3-bin5]|nr:hypothetical protein [Microcoleus sp. T3-bin5]